MEAFLSKYRWKALDFAALKHSSVSFFDVKKPETAVSRWARARTRVAKVLTIIPYHTLWCFILFQRTYPVCSAFSGREGFIQG